MHQQHGFYGGPWAAALMGAENIPGIVISQAARNIPHMFLTLSATYVGIAQGAYDFTVQYLRGEIPGAQGSKSRQHSAKQYTVAEMFIKLEQIRALFIRSIHEIMVNPEKPARLRGLCVPIHYHGRCSRYLPISGSYLWRTLDAENISVEKDVS